MLLLPRLHYTVGTGTACKGKETFAFVGGGLGFSEGQKVMSTGLPLPTFFRKLWGSVVKRGLCSCLDKYGISLGPNSGVLMKITTEDNKRYENNTRFVLKHLLFRILY